jgi:predicted HTH transcriptional regulator
MKENQTVEFKEFREDELLKIPFAILDIDGVIFHSCIPDSGNPSGLKNLKQLLKGLSNKLRENTNDNANLKIVALYLEFPVSYRGRSYTGANSTKPKSSSVKPIETELKKQRLLSDSFLSTAIIAETCEATFLKLWDGAKERLAIPRKDFPEIIPETLKLAKNGKLYSYQGLFSGKIPQRYFQKAGRLNTPVEIIYNSEVRTNLHTRDKELIKPASMHIIGGLETDSMKKNVVCDYLVPAIREAYITAQFHGYYIDTTETQIKTNENRSPLLDRGILHECLTFHLSEGNHFSKEEAC